MQSGKTYLTLLGLFAAFLVVSTMQLGKTRTTVGMLEKHRINTVVTPDAASTKSRSATAGIRLHPGIAAGHTVLMRRSLLFTVYGERTDSLQSSPVGLP